MPKRKTWLSVSEAIQTLKQSKIKTNRVTFLKWIDQYDLGQKVGGRWVIYPERLERFMKDYFHIGKIYAKKRES